MKTTVEEDPCEILWRAAETGNSFVVSELLRSDVDVSASNAFGTTALMRAVAAGRMEIVSLLLDHGANPNEPRKDGFTPLLLAAFYGHADIVRTLIEHGANSNATTRFGTSAKMWASARTFYEVVDYLEGQQKVSRTVKTIAPTKPTVDDQVPSSVFDDSVDEIRIVQRPTFDRRHTAVACVLSAALLLGGAILTRIKLRPTESTSAKTIQSVAAAERVRTDNQAPARTATADSPEVEKKPDNNHHTPQPDTRSNDRKSTIARIPEVTSIPTIPSATTSDTRTQETDNGAVLTVAPLEVRKTATVVTPNNTLNSSVTTRIPVNNNQLISPKNSNKSGKVISWP